MIARYEKGDMVDAETLRRFFVGEAAVGEVLPGLTTIWTVLPNGTREFSCTELDADFCLEAVHLVRVCDAVLAGELAPALLENIGDCLVGTTCWRWDDDQGDVVARVAHAWATPAINYRLTIGTAAKFRHWLLTGEMTFADDDF